MVCWCRLQCTEPNGAGVQRYSHVWSLCFYWGQADFAVYGNPSWWRNSSKQNAAAISNLQEHFMDTRLMEALCLGLFPADNKCHLASAFSMQIVYLINETPKTSHEYKRKWSKTELVFEVPYQSQLTANVVKDITQEAVGLPMYDESAKLHMTLLAVFSIILIRKQIYRLKQCPITKTKVLLVGAGLMGAWVRHKVLKCPAVDYDVVGRGRILAQRLKRQPAKTSGRRIRWFLNKTKPLVILSRNCCHWHRYP